MKIRTKLFISFAAVVIAFGILSAFIGVRLIQNRVVSEAQTRVQSDLNSAWGVLNAELRNIETILKLASGAQPILEASFNSNWPNQDAQSRIEMIRMDFGLDFLGIVSPKGQVVARAVPPYNTGDFLLSNPAIFKALKGESVTSIELMSKEDMTLEQTGLSDRAFLVLEDTPHAKPSPKTEETRGMVLIGAVPIERGRQILGVIYGGILLNRNYAMVDRITDIVFKQTTQNSPATGTVTIFLSDSRIATTVRLANGNRAIGTRVSKEVADRVLENGMRWEGKAFVVNDWYLTAYDPIKDFQGSVIGMLYVGIVERPFTDMIKDTILKYILLSIFGITVALILAFFLAGRIAGPTQRLAAAAQQMHIGEQPAPVSTEDAGHETKALIHSFNEMAEAIFERETRLKEANEKLEDANVSLTNLNRSYMEMLGFISHELKSPLATIMNYVYLIREQKLGPLTDKQHRAMGNIDNNVKLIVEMARHYLNLSRIESGELEPVTTRVEVVNEVLTPLIDSFSPAAAERKMTILNTIGQDVVLQTDLNMTREVFENLISNAIKYGRDGGAIKLTAQTAGDFVRFSVFNEGEGVAPEKINALFQKFSRLEEDKVARKQKGTGLGLFICKYIMEAHRGEIQVNSKQGEWIEFIFTLPQYREADV
jgi:two-component system NtrC family sensor kinase